MDGVIAFIILKKKITTLLLLAGVRLAVPGLPCTEAEGKGSHPLSAVSAVLTVSSPPVLPSGPGTQVEGERKSKQMTQMSFIFGLMVCFEN